jgi:acyl-CoA synthetase (AMP-forming)/AMP-acid ligase II
MEQQFTGASEPATLVELLRRRASSQPEKPAFIFLEDGENTETAITFGELDRQARAIAAWLGNLGAAGERALLLYPPGLDFIAAFFGCLYAGVTAVPAYPPRLNRPVPRIQGIVADAHATVALTTTEILASLEQRFEHTPDLRALRWLNTQHLPSGAETEWRPPHISPQTLAFLQYTSGSTSQPKGVMLTHANLLHNLKLIRSGFRTDEHARGVIWLPSYHDMGLIGGILEPIFMGGMSVLMPPFAFLQRPVRWLQAITRYKGTISGAPNFAYDLCVDKVSTQHKETLDLSSLQVAFCGAEPVRIETLDRFSEAFAECGFRSEAFYPCYGLAEASLFVTGGIEPGKPATLTVQRPALENDRVVEATQEDENTLTLVDCGQPHLDERVVIAHPQTLRSCQPDEIGEIWVSSPSVAQGYWERPGENERIFHAFLSDTGEGPFLRTGDLGFLRNGLLFVTGRLKDLIIILGRNHYPQDIEQTVEVSHPALQPAAGAAFSVLVGGEERLVVVQEVARQYRNANMDEVLRAIRRAIAENHDLQVYAIVLIRPLTIEKTSSGKIKRHASKAAFLSNNLEVIAEWRAPIPHRLP